LCKGVCGTGISLARAASGQLIGQKKIIKKKKNYEFRHANMS
jgi:hypothetical protein